MRCPGHIVKFVAALSIVVCSATAQRGSSSLLFQRFPFDKWATEEARPQIKWNVHVEQARLSGHQRLLTQLRMVVDGSELQKRQGKGQMLMFLRVEDSAGHTWQTGNQLFLGRFREGTKFRQLDYNVSAFILPGDYTVSFAVCDDRTLEHSFARRRVHIAGISSDPLPGIWQDLPAVEFLPPNTDAPEAWYLPMIRSRMALPVETHRPVRIEILVNTTPSRLNSMNLFRLNMDAIVPALKVLTGLSPTSGSAGLSIVDINRRSVTYEQPDVGAVDWRSMRKALTEFSSAKVDVSTLAGQRKMLDYFSAEAVHRLGDASVPHVLIVLSAPVFFTKQEKPPPPELPPDPNRRVFYIRYSSPASEGSFADDLEHALKPLRPRTFRVLQPEGFRKALGVIVEEISKM
jgi:hypothetical protein